MMRGAVGRLTRQSVGAVATIMALVTMGTMARPATASTPPVPVLGEYPQFLTPRASTFRATGSEETYYVMNAVGNLYSQSSIFGCSLSRNDFRTCTPAADGPATDVLDNYSRNEFVNGAAIGTDAGIGQLCGTRPTGGLAVDFARAARAPNTGDNCPAAVGLEFARDSVVGVVFPFHNTTSVACTTGACSAGQIGPVAAGWRPGDRLAGPYSGVAFSNVDNTASSALGGRSLVFEIYCDTTTGSRIDDWGQLTDATLDPVTGRTRGSEGIGAPIGVPISIPAVNTPSGTSERWKTYVGCDPASKNHDHRPVRENEAPQLSNIAALDHPADNIAAANQVAASLYFISYGAAQWRPYTYSVGDVSGKLTRINGLAASPAVELNRSIATGRGLYNVYRSDRLRSSVAGFLNFLCGTDPARSDHGLDRVTGRNYGDELTNTISTQFVVPRVACTVDPSGHPVPPLTPAMITDFEGASPPPPVKPQVSGACDRQHIAGPVYLGVVNCFVVKIDWSDLQPTEGGPVASNNLIDQAIVEANRQNAAHPGANMRLKLRVYAGIAAPEWAKRLDGPPVTLRDPQTGAVIDTVPRFWTARFGAAYDDLMGQLATRYDNTPVLLEVAVSRCTTQFAEPFLRQATSADNRAVYLAAGYTVAQDEACERAQLDTHARLWRHTRTGVAFSPFQSLDADGVHQDEAFTEQMMVYCRSLLRSRCVLGNNAISWPLDGGSYTSMYDKIAALGGPIYFQTATADKIGDWRATLDWAARQGAGMVELPAGYDPAYALADLTAYDARLEANRAP